MLFRSLDVFTKLGVATFTDVGRDLYSTDRRGLQALAPMSVLERKDQEYQRIARCLLQRYGRGRYESTKVVNLVIEMLFRAEKGWLGIPFAVEKAGLRKMVRLSKQETPPGIKKNEGQLPSPATFEKVINSLGPIYQEILEAVRS